MSGAAGSETHWTPPFVVRVVDGRDIARWLLHPATTTIGHEQGMDVRVGAEVDSVSRRQAVFVRSGDQVQIEDIGFRDGTFAGGKPVGLASLSDGDAIRFGEWTMRFEAGPRRGDDEDSGAAGDA